MAHDHTANDQQPLEVLKTSALDRRLSIAKTSLNIGRRWAANSAFGLFKSKEEKQAQKQVFMREQAQYLVTELGKLKGSVVKIGQMLALYGEHFLPPEITQALQTLNDNTTTFAYPIIAAAIRQELGEDMAAFEIDPVAIGTASLAQVHQAIHQPTGTHVALKVQYPNIANAIDSDLALFRHLLKVTNAVPQTRELDAWFEEIRDLLHHEVDYQQEAATTQRFYARLQGDNRYIVPKILPEYSTNRLLCMSFEAGISILDPTIAELPQSRRNAIGLSAMNIMLREIFEWGEMQTDPNFGNYLIRLSDDPDHKPDALVLLDFGAIRAFDAPLLAIAKALLRAGYYHDKSAMLQAIRTAGVHFEFFAGLSDASINDMADLFLLASEPFSLPSHNPTIPAPALAADGGYRWAASDLHHRVMKQIGQSATSTAFSVPPKELMFISRKFIGAYTLMTVLDAHTHASELMQDFIR